VACAVPCRELKGYGRLVRFDFDAQLASHVSAEATHHGQLKAGALAIYLAGEERIDNADHHFSRFRAFQGDAKSLCTRLVASEPDRPGGLSPD
jgi:hypothetical protein